MQEEHELEMKAEELFNMTFGPLTWNPDDEDEAKDIVDCAVKDGLMAMPRTRRTWRNASTTLQGTRRTG